MIRNFVACHVDVKRPATEYLTPIQTGCLGRPRWDGYLHDDIGDNISTKNRFFGEHTGLYWIWKNTADEEIGWCHYRRFFSPMLLPNNQHQIETPLQAAQTILDIDKAGIVFNYELGFADIILPQRFGLPGPISAQYAGVHRPQDWIDMMTAFNEFYPGEAGQAQQYFNTTTNMHGFCMFMTKRPAFNAFCEWLFPLLFFLEGRITPPEDAYQGRVFSYLAERLFNWWVASRGLRATYRPVVFVQ